MGSRFATLWVMLALLSVVPARAADPVLTIVRDGKATAFSAAEIAALPHADAPAYDMHEKKEHVYSGVAVHALLEKAGVAFGEKMRGKDMRQVVLVCCGDGYEVVFALAEFDPNFHLRTILLADRRDGRPLPPGLGPLRLINAGDKRPARWAHDVTSLVVFPVQAPRP